jgi:drug/metabolite transporter (DMT)-like permease
MKYALITIGMLLLAAGVMMTFSSMASGHIPGALLTIAGAILITGGSLLDRLEKRR